MGNWPFAIRQDKRDTTIKELQNKITTLEADAETQEATLKAKDVFIAALKADKQRLEQESTERFHTILELRKEMSARDERIRELEAAVASWDAANGELQGRIQDLRDANSELGLMRDELLALVHKIAEGAYIDQRGGGAALVKQARDLIKQYDSPSDKPCKNHCNRS